MEFIVSDEITDFKEDQWNFGIPSEELFHQHSFLEGLKAAQVENSKLFFAVLKNDKRIVGSAVLSCFDIHLDLFIGESAVVKKLKKYFPKFFKVSVLFCGTPLSAGHKNLYVNDETLYPIFLEKIADWMEVTAVKHKIPFLIFKEFSEGEKPSLQALEKRSYFKAHSLPNVILNLKGNSYNEFLDELRYSYRRQIKYSLKKINAKNPIYIDDYFSSEKAESHPVFTVLNPNEFGAENFYSLYKSVMGRAKVKLEELNKPFFDEFFSRYSQDLHLLCMVYKKQVLGVFVLAIVDKKMSFYWTGKNQEKDPWDSYSNLMTAMVFLAYKKGCTQINLGQTSYYPKQKIGGEIQELFFYFKARKFWKNSLLKMLNPLIFPAFKFQKIRAFK